MDSSELRARLRRSLVIPAHPLALTSARKLDERRQRALTRYYRDAGAGGVAVAVHTTQFALRDHGLLAPVLELAREESGGMLRVAGALSLADVETAARIGYDTVLLNVSRAPDPLEYARQAARILPVFGFYLQPAVGGRVLPYMFWREFCEIENVVAIKVAPFNRYQTLDVIRAVAESGRADEIALYTGNDDHIILDLCSPHFAGGLLGHWAVWARRAVEHLALCRQRPSLDHAWMDQAWVRFADQVTDANAALFDAANGFAGCVAGLHEILRRQGLLAGRWCLDPNEDLSPGQMEEIDRICGAYPHLTDDAFVAENLDRWLR
jgi:dihydrodipicolinate synthase/N-acetylneuraminate lyase